MTFPVVVTQDAIRELEAQMVWYENRRRFLGSVFLKEFEDAVGYIRSFPTIHPVQFDDVRRHLFHRFPFALYYRFDGAFVRIYGVLHCARNPRGHAKRIKRRKN